MNGADTLLSAALAVPIVMLAACMFRSARTRMPALLALAPVPALAAAAQTVGSAPMTLPRTFLHTTLALDVPAALLLAAAAILWITAGAYACTYLRDKPNAGSFSAWWLTAMIGNLGVLMAADTASFYLFFAIGSLGAYGLISHEMTFVSRRAAVVYVAFALLSEACVLMGLVLLTAAAPENTLVIHDAVAALPTSPWRDATLALLIIGFGIKIGLAPLHIWMPLAYTAAPIPAAAVLSGAAVKAGVIGLIRFLPFAAAQPGWGEMLAAVGFFSALYGVVRGLRQDNPKTVLAYSSISQMGLIAAATGIGLATGYEGSGLAVAFYAAHHVLVKGALFLAIGTTANGPRRAWMVLLPAAVIALGLAGLPFTGGYLAKMAVKPLFEGDLALLAALCSAGSALLMFHFMNRLARIIANDPESAGLTLPWLCTFVAAIIFPWALFPAAVSGQAFEEIFNAGNLSTATWPILLGGLLAIGYGLWTYRPRTPTDADFGAEFDLIQSAARIFGMAFERADSILRQWQVAGISLLAIAIVLATAIASGH